MELDIRRDLDRLGGVRWLEAGKDEWPGPVDNRIEVGSLLTWAGGLELGRDNREEVEMVAVRVNSFLNPYEIGALLQLAALKATSEDLPTAFEKLNEAAKLAPPSDVRTRLRMLQYSRLATSENPIPWNSDTVAQELDGILAHRLQEYPENALFNAAKADLLAFKGDLRAALAASERACSLPGATREMHLRRAYYLVRLDRMDDAWSVVSSHLPADSPYLSWANSLASEAIATDDSGLAAFAIRVYEHLGHPIQPTAPGDTE
jgi:hypothetical protein